MPVVVIVGGPPGTGKTTLAHAIGAAMPAPVISRDEIKEGLARDAGNAEATDIFFGTIALRARDGVTLVVEAAFRPEVWASRLEPIREAASLRVIECTVALAIARERIVRRLESEPSRRAHADEELLAQIDRGALDPTQYHPLVRGVPSIVVDTTNGYHPQLEEIVAFARG